MNAAIDIEEYFIAPKFDNPGRIHDIEKPYKPIGTKGNMFSRFVE